MHTCSKCLKDKPDEEFFDRNTSKCKSSWCRNCLYEVQKQRWIARKMKVIQIMGGKCNRCNYARNPACLELHHIDPNTKEHDWNKLRLLKWETVIKEIQKCELLCCRCHREHHHPNEDLNTTEFDSRANINKDFAPKPTGKCPNCESPTFHTKYCSQVCSQFSKRKVTRPDRATLEKEVESLPITTIGEKYNVTGNSIRKWCKAYGIAL